MPSRKLNSYLSSGHFSFYYLDVGGKWHFLFIASGNVDLSGASRQDTPLIAKMLWPPPQQATPPSQPCILQQQLGACPYSQPSLRETFPPCLVEVVRKVTTFHSCVPFYSLATIVAQRNSGANDPHQQPPAMPGAAGVALPI
ncbi:hypothetical protein TREES_T100010056 [Tupaia chinensis]|uniref:Uncharacterized protein n=1 Tax=Tupaia chinensis TaxID=246437 RepID=L9KFH0_TUPCH|nr:hypothetical protein TREES_T100010056 [Tupaia chinensis]